MVLSYYPYVRWHFPEICFQHDFSIPYFAQETCLIVGIPVLVDIFPIR